MYSEEYERRWAQLRGKTDVAIAMLAWETVGGEHPQLLPMYLRYSHDELEKLILRSEFPAEASCG